MLRDTMPKDNPAESPRRQKEKEMSNALIIFKQTVIMFLYMAAGFMLFRAKLITREGSASMANLLLTIIIPSVLILLAR